MRTCLARASGGVMLVAIAALTTSCLGPIERPVADFVWCPDGSEGRLDYWFSSISTPVPGHTIERLEWHFGDGAFPIAAICDGYHRFEGEGLHVVTLTVIDSRGVAGTATKKVPIALAAFVHSAWRLTPGYPPTVSGVVENRFSGRLNVVAVRAKFYDAEGVRLTDGRVEILDLDPGERAAFEIRAQEFSARIFYATVDVEWFSADCPLRHSMIE